MEYVAAYYARVSGRLPKQVKCESCGFEFAYESAAEVIGRSTGSRCSPERAKEIAHEKLRNELQAPGLVACPGCGWFQADMVRHLKCCRRRTSIKAGIWAFCVATILGWTVLLVTENRLAGVLPPALVAVVLPAAMFWYANRDPNCQGSDGDRRLRAIASQGIPLVQYNEARMEEERIAAERRARGPDELHSLMDDLSRSPEMALKIRRDQEQRERRRLDRRTEQRRRTVLLIVALSVGAALGVALDCILFDAVPDKIMEGVIGGLGGGVLGAVLGVMLVIQFYLPWYVFVSEVGELRTRRFLARLPDPWTAMAILGVIGAQMLSRILAMVGRSGLRAQAVVLLCQLLMLLGVRIIYPGSRPGQGNSGEGH